MYFRIAKKFSAFALQGFDLCEFACALNFAHSNISFEINRE
jgi:hypothetical protein